ncbi:cobyrinic acid a,c-diamide synthase [Pseudomonas oryzihabitans]|uniref:Cobyrinic acid a,c-diamide synthase n=1 Tax=Pseudomonas oryzihabitans TaxID=47885 RepID=A0A2Z5AIQ4_9PSED|nr:ParA family protein [Pseudomonas oryzihabitans]AXA69050.1 cobyrinic acid a,c-diamide synthase [Pseudomonas oryzihabitans]
MKTTSAISTKGGTGKTTKTANLGAFCADAGLRTLLIDLDPVQPSLSSYYDLVEPAPCGVFELIASNETRLDRIVSKTNIQNLSLIYSNDPHNHLINLLLQAPDGRLRLAHLKEIFAKDFDLVLIDTQGARTVLLEMVMLASDLAVSPLPPEMLSAREFNRGTLQMLDGLRPYARLGLPVPPIKAVVNGLDLTSDARTLDATIRETFRGHADIQVIDTVIPDAVVYCESATHGIPAHRLEYRQPSNRQAPAALQVIRNLAIELFPEWADRFTAMNESVVHALVKEGK